MGPEPLTSEFQGLAPGTPEHQPAAPCQPASPEGAACLALVTLCGPIRTDGAACLPPVWFGPYCMVFLGSMGTGEDLFYKCCAHSEELSTHSKFPRNFSLKFGTLTMSLSFLKDNNIYYLYILIDTYTCYDSRVISTCVNSNIRQRYFELFPCL